MLKDQGKNDVYDWLVETTKPVGKEVKAGGLSLSVSAVTILLAAITMAFLM